MQSFDSTFQKELFPLPRLQEQGNQVTFTLHGENGSALLLPFAHPPQQKAPVSRTSFPGKTRD